MHILAHIKRGCLHLSLTDFVHTLQFLQQIDCICIVTNHEFAHSTEVGWVAAVVADAASQRGRCATQGRPANENMSAIEICWICVTSSSSYSNSLEVKARSLEVWRFPGIGFSSCTAPTFSRVQGISNGGHELSFRNVPEQRSVPERFRV